MKYKVVKEFIENALIARPGSMVELTDEANAKDLAALGYIELGKAAPKKKQAPKNRAMKTNKA